MTLRETQLPPILRASGASQDLEAGGWVGSIGPTPGLAVWREVKRRPRPMSEEQVKWAIRSLY